MTIANVIIWVSTTRIYVSFNAYTTLSVRSPIATATATATVTPTCTSTPSPSH